MKKHTTFEKRNDLFSRRGKITDCRDAVRAIFRCKLFQGLGAIKRHSFRVRFLLGEGMLFSVCSQSNGKFHKKNADEKVPKSSRK